MRVGIGVLQLEAREFWLLTPIEFEAALHGFYGLGGSPSLPDRQVLDQLIAEFPDISK